VVLAPHAFAGIGADWNVDSSSEFGVDTKNTDWSAIFGLDLMINLSRCVVVADARYSVGLTDIQQASDAVGDFKNRAWLLSAGLGFNF
jgi:hypothetical protein